MKKIYVFISVAIGLLTVSTVFLVVLVLLNADFSIPTCTLATSIPDIQNCR